MSGHAPLRTLLPALVLIAVGCTPEQDVNRVITSDVFLQEPTNEVDILWVIDNSRSMEDEQALVADGFVEFISNVEASNADFHIGVITTDMDDPDHKGKLQGEPRYITPDDDYVAMFQERVQVGVTGSDQEKGIDAAYTALAEPLVSGYNAGFRRDTATLSIIYVSDENDCTDRGALGANDDVSACYEYGDRLVDVRDLIRDYKDVADKQSRLVVSAIVGPEVDAGCEGSKPGFRYLAMAEAFGGIQSSICEADYANIMRDLSLEVSGLQTSFQLSHSAVEETIEVVADDTIIPADADNGWTYDDTYWIVYFHGDGVPPRGSQITITYEIASGGQRADTGGATQ